MNPEDLLSEANLEQAKQVIADKASAVGDSVGSLLQGAMEVGGEVLDAVDLDAVGGLIEGAAEVAGSVAEGAMEVIGGILGALGE